MAAWRIMENADINADPVETGKGQEIDDDDDETQSLYYKL